MSNLIKIFLKKVKSFIYYRYRRWKHLNEIIKDQNEAASYLRKYYVTPYIKGEIPKIKVYPKKELGTDKIIWQYWGQGIDDSTPKIVQMCFESVDKYKGEYKQIILTNETIKDYVDIPEFVYEKLENNQEFTMTFFSDLLRVYLLSAYGGIWIDATVLLTDNIREEWLKKDFFAFQRTKRPKNYKEWQKLNEFYFCWNKKYKVKLLSSFIIAKRGNIIIDALKDILTEYWRKEKDLKHYFLMHLIFDEFLNITTYKKANCEKVSDLLPHNMLLNIERPYSIQLFNSIKSKCEIHKLTYWDDIKHNSILEYLINPQAVAYPAKRQIGVLLIILGRYSIFWKDFYKSCEKYFLPNCPKTYFVFTDNDNLMFNKKSNVNIIKQEKMGWPYDSLLRFDMFLSKKEELLQYDYLFFFNIDILFKNTVGEEILPTAYYDGLMTGSHVGFYDKKTNEFTYDRNPKSTACIPYGQGKHYATGAINGGTSDAFMKLAETCSKNIHIDMRNNVMAVWHDESHLNKYLLDKNPLIMSVNYLYPLWMDKTWLRTNNFRKDVKIVIRDKVRSGGGTLICEAKLM